MISHPAKTHRTDGRLLEIGRTRIKGPGGFVEMRREALLNSAGCVSFTGGCEVLLERQTSANNTLWSLSSMSVRNANERDNRTIHGAGRPSDRPAWRGERGCNRQSPQRRTERCPQRQRSGDPSPKLNRAGSPSGALAEARPGPRPLTKTMKASFPAIKSAAIRCAAARPE